MSEGLGRIPPEDAKNVIRMCEKLQNVSCDEEDITKVASALMSAEFSVVHLPDGRVKASELTPDEWATDIHKLACGHWNECKAAWIYADLPSLFTCMMDCFVGAVADDFPRRKRAAAFKEIVSSFERQDFANAKSRAWSLMGWPDQWGGSIPFEDVARCAHYICLCHYMTSIDSLRLVVFEEYMTCWCESFASKGHQCERFPKMVEVYRTVYGEYMLPSKHRLTPGYRSTWDK